MEIFMILSGFGRRKTKPISISPQTSGCVAIGFTEEDCSVGHHGKE
jgi:hypothetical protein